MMRTKFSISARVRGDSRLSLGDLRKLVDETQDMPDDSPIFSDRRGLEFALYALNVKRGTTDGWA